MTMYQRIVPQGVTTRLNELFDAIKQEVENLTQEASMFRYHKDDFEHKITSQIQEMQTIQKSIYDLETAHRKITQDYEEEITRLRRELENRGGSSSQHSARPGEFHHSGSQTQTPVQPLPSQAQQQNQQQTQQLQQSSQQSQLPQQPVPKTEMSLPSIGLGQNNLFGPMMNGQQKSMGQNLAQQSGNTAVVDGVQNNIPPYPSVNGVYSMNGGNGHPGPIQPHPSKRGRTDEAQPGNQSSPGKSAQSPYAGAKAPPTSQKVGLNAQQSRNQTSERPVSTVSTEIDYDRIGAEYKKDNGDWSVIFNPMISRNLDIQLVHTFEHSSVVCCVRFSLDGTLLATGCNRAAIIFDVKTGQLVTTLQDETLDREGDLYVRSVAFSPDNKLLATGAEDKQIRVWDIAKKRIRNLFIGHELDIYSLDYSSNGRYIASGSGDRTARIWDMETNVCVLTLSIEDGVTTIAFSPDCQYVAAGSLDKIVRVWSINGELLERLEGHRDRVYSVAFSPNSKMLLSGSLDKRIKLWDIAGIHSNNTGPMIQSGFCRSTFVGHKDFVLSVGVSPDCRWVVSGSKDRSVQFWDPKTAQSQLLLYGHKNSVISVHMSPVGNLFATGSGDSRARIWSYETRD